MWINSHQWNAWRITYSCCWLEDLENSDQNDLYSDMLKLPEQPAEGTAPVDLPTQICYGGNKYLLWLIIKLFDSIYYSCFNYSNIWLISIISPQLTYSGSVQSISHVQLFVIPWTAACQASLSFINSWSLLKLMSTESVMPSNHLILFCPLLLLTSIFPSIRVFSNELVLLIRWTKSWSFSFSISSSNEYSELISFRIGWLDLLADILRAKEK